MHRAFTFEEWHYQLSITLQAVREPLTNPAGVAFWASMMPSVWLWLYLIAASCARAFGTFDPAIRFARRFLEVDKYPIRSVGFVAAVLVTGAYGVLALLSTIWGTVHSALAS
jgi:hypothetical protein